MPFYRGNPAGGRFVGTVLDDRGQLHGLDPRLDIRNHSPSGFAWGYSGSGPAQLALAILCDALGDDERAELLYQHFKDAVIARLDRDRHWILARRSVLDIVSRLENDVAS
ncbi:DUF6166 domain-containing protein [Mesorhizobium australicum]|uniref:Uncharacterized protein n=1 Tax=Mesorhizobium australicum TaxID=536018 RepID=A0A1X7MR76_9HYPH|nr:DUF6166 domain-containing protein [Mesorhizobium australicum]SMH26473.1 hypothetical protein SAMN02982922_0268 [Mesorhizobium australicum]